MSQNKPIKTYRAGRIQASIWKNEKERNGQTMLQHSIRIQKQFKKEDGEYQNTDYFFPDDLPKLNLVSQKAYEYIKLKQSDTENAES